MSTTKYPIKIDTFYMSLSGHPLLDVSCTVKIKDFIQAKEAYINKLNWDSQFLK